MSTKRWHIRKQACSFYACYDSVSLNTGIARFVKGLSKGCFSMNIDSVLRIFLWKLYYLVSGTVFNRKYRISWISQKMKFSIKFPADLVTFTEETFNGRFHFLCSEAHSWLWKRPWHDELNYFWNTFSSRIVLQFFCLVL